MSYCPTRHGQWTSMAMVVAVLGSVSFAYAQAPAGDPPPPQPAEAAQPAEVADKPAATGEPSGEAAVQPQTEPQVEQPQTEPQGEQGEQKPQVQQAAAQEPEASAQPAPEQVAEQVQQEPAAAAAPADEAIAAGADSAQQPDEDAAKEPKPEEEPEPSWTDHIKIGGDFRYRFETIDLEDKDFRYRHRIRARPRVQATVVDGLDVVLQLGTGGADDPVSNNQSLTEAFSSKPIWLDLGYFQWHPSFFEPLHLWGGKMKNPYYKVGKTELLWDPDLNPEGLALNLKNKWGMFEPFFTGTAFFVEERKEDDDTWLLGVQAGLKVDLSDDRLYVLVGGGYVDYTSITDKEVLWDPEDSYGNSATGVDLDDDGEPDFYTYDHDYDLLNGFVEIGGKVFGIPWAAFVDLVSNTAADEDKTGWLFGALLGKTKKPLDFHLRYIYREVQKDAVLGLLTDSDFIGGGADGKGHEWNLAFQPANHVVLAFTYFYNRTPMTDGKDYHRSQTDLKLKF